MYSPRSRQSKVHHGLPVFEAQITQLFIADAVLGVGCTPQQLLLGCDLHRRAADVLVGFAVKVIVRPAGQTR